MESVPSLVMLALLIFVFYFMLIRPQKKRVDQHRKLVESLSLGDEVVTVGGLHGRVSRMGDEDIELQVAEGVRLRFVRNAIARKVEASEPEATDETEETTGGTS